MSTTLLIHNQESFDSFARSITWDDAYVKETHTLNPLFEEDYTIHPSIGPIGRLLIVLPEEEFKAIEFFGFELKSLTVCHGNEILPAAIIKRRQAELDLQAAHMVCSSIMIRYLNSENAAFGSVYSSDPLFTKNDSLVAPYDIDWRSALDD